MLHVIGSDHDDYFQGTVSFDGSGNDNVSKARNEIRGGKGNDTIKGGDGHDDYGRYFGGYLNQHQVGNDNDGEDSLYGGEGGQAGDVQA